MALDPNIALQVRPFKMDSPINAMAQMYQLQGAQQANQLNAMQMAEYERARAEEEGARNFLTRADLKTPEARTELTTRYGKTGMALAKSLAEQDAAMLKQKADQLDYTTKVTDAAASIYGTVKDDASWQAAKPRLAALGGDPKALPETYDPDFVRREMLAATKVKDQLTLFAPKPKEVKRADGSIIFLDENPNSPSYGKEVLPAQAAGMTPFETARVPILQQTANAASSQANTARSGLSLRALQADPFNMSGAQAAFPLAPASGGGGNAMAPTNGANAMAPRPAVAPAPAIAPTAPADTISGRQMPLGEAINKGITGPDLLAVIPKSLAGQVSAILEHRAAPPSGNTTRSSQLMQIVQAADPTYDAQQYKTKQGIETAFTAGLPSRTLKSINVADDHLKVLNNTISALQNGDVKLLNQLGNTIATQMGAPAPTDFNGVKTIVADELVKAILGGAGALGDRKAIQETISSASSPDQLRSMIKRYQEMMEGQRTGLAEQYKSGGGNNANVLSLLNKNKPAAAAGVDTSNPLLAK
jgi:hypothetical protein